MVTIERTAQFKRDYKRELKGRYKNSLSAELTTLLQLLISADVLPDNYRDHALSGNWKEHRDCHLKPDLILIYRQSNPEQLQLIRLGSHSELSL